MIILLSGFLCCGKDTLGLQIKKYLPEYQCYALSKTAKDLASERYKFPREWADQRDEKERPRPEFQGQSVRDLVRSIWIELDQINPTLIGEKIAKQIQTKGQNKVVITDLRLERDFNYFVKTFGRQAVLTLKINRLSLALPNRNTHPEEYALEHFTFDKIIANNDTPFDMYTKFYQEVFPLTHQGQRDPNFYYLRAPKHLISELRHLMNYYEFKSEIIEFDGNDIQRAKLNHPVAFKYSSLEDFLLGEIFYKNPKNLHYFPIQNPKSEVINFDVSPYNLIATNPITGSLCYHPIYQNYLNQVSNYGTFIRLCENKVQRLYWNLPLNAGLPLTPKDKDPVAEMVFLLHDYGHFLLPDLVFTGHSSNLTDQLYVCWRLLGESITIVLNEMLIVNQLKDMNEFKAQIKTGFDKPYRLYELICHAQPLQTLGEIKALFWASYQFFCAQNPSGFLVLADCDENNPIWQEFNQRYLPISQRGKEWTLTNLVSLKADASAYCDWWDLAQSFAQPLQLVTIDEIEIEIRSMNVSADQFSMMRYLFEKIWDQILRPLLSGSVVHRIHDDQRKVLAFQRLMIGNLLLLVKLQRPNLPILIESWKAIDVNQIDVLRESYQDEIKSAYVDGKISANEYHNAKNIYVMIPPNVLKKTNYP